jgi:hypothetical protein
MNATNCTDGPFCARFRLLQIVPAPREPAEGDLAIDGAVATTWRALGGVERARTSAFLSGAQGPDGAYDVYPDAALPEEFACDFACGGPTLRAAFPHLVRRVIGIDRRGERITVRVACVGDQRGAFFCILSPTGRRVAFDVVHRIVIREGRVAEHRVAIDIRAIVLQLVARG